MTLPAVALVGRQNVGKSTLANRLFGSREAIAHETPGVTRDRVELEAAWRGRAFRVVDTGGYVQGARGIEQRVAKQADRAMEAADVIVLVVDAQTGPVEDDALLARGLQRATVPVVLAANKVDSDREESDALTFLRLGLGEPIPVSALHGRGSGDLLDHIVELLPEESGVGETGDEPSFLVHRAPPDDSASADSADRADFAASAASRAARQRAVKAAIHSGSIARQYTRTAPRKRSAR
jgi:GTP-binding protein